MKLKQHVRDVAHNFLILVIMSSNTQIIATVTLDIQALQNRVDVETIQLKDVQMAFHNSKDQLVQVCRSLPWFCRINYFVVHNIGEGTNTDR
jgi:hypothetical protein